MSGKDGNVGQRNRRDRLIQEEIHDPYMTGRKSSGPAVCPECKAVLDSGRWQWLADIPEGAEELLCPACRRIREKVPAGILNLSGAFFVEHRDEIMNLIHNKVEAEKAQHPMKRLMGIEEQEDGTTVVTFTDVHLPRGVGQAIGRAYEGELDIQYTDEAGLVRVYWQR